MWPPQAMPYGEALYFLRYYMTLPWSSAATAQSLTSDHYTIHGLKCTLLSWACQLGLSEEDRRQHGKHKPAQQSVALYSRDDVVGSLRLQQQLIDKICGGWRPCTPLARGANSQFKTQSSNWNDFAKIQAFCHGVSFNSTVCHLLQMNWFPLCRNLMRQYRNLTLTIQVRRNHRPPPQAENLRRNQQKSCSRNAKFSPQMRQLTSMRLAYIGSHGTS